MNIHIIKIIYPSMFGKTYKHLKSGNLEFYLLLYLHLRF